jgi:hypothetical protein
LSTGSIEVQGRFSNSSNNTLLVTVSDGSEELMAVYKPEQGERPLWDFPLGLWRREVAAYELSSGLGLDLVPLTIVRHDAPFGVGSLQVYVDEDMEHHYFTLREQEQLHRTMIAIAGFDVVANNSDRKSGHVLFDHGRLWLIDHGLCFHEEDKLRTVVWDFAGEPLDEPFLAALRSFCATPPEVLTELLAPRELSRTIERADELLAAGSLPFPDEDRDYPPYPWPLV